MNDLPATMVQVLYAFESRARVSRRRFPRPSDIMPDATHPTENPSRLEQEGIQAISDFTEVVEELNSSRDLTSDEYKRLLDAGMRMYRATPMRIAKQANQHSRAAYLQGFLEGSRRQRAATFSYLQAEPGRVLEPEPGRVPAEPGRETLGPKEMPPARAAQ